MTENPYQPGTATNESGENRGRTGRFWAGITLVLFFGLIELRFLQLRIRWANSVELPLTYEERNRFVLWTVLSSVMIATGVGLAFGKRGFLIAAIATTAFAAVVIYWIMGVPVPK